VSNGKGTRQGGDSLKKKKGREKRKSIFLHRERTEGVVPTTANGPFNLSLERRRRRSLREEKKYLCVLGSRRDRKKRMWEYLTYSPERSNPRRKGEQRISGGGLAKRGT